MKKKISYLQAQKNYELWTMMLGMATSSHDKDIIRAELLKLEKGFMNNEFIEDAATKKRSAELKAFGEKTAKFIEEEKEKLNKINIIS